MAPHKCTFLLLCYVFIDTFTMITCNDAPKISLILPSRELIEGMNYPLLCIVDNGISPIHFKWYKNGRLLDVQSAYGLSVESDTIKSLLTIERVTYDHIANYTCVATNNYGEDRKSAVLSLKGSPVPVPDYYSSVIIVIPFVVAIIIIVIACVVAYWYVHYDETKSKLIHGSMTSASPSKNFQYFGTGTGTPYHSGRQSVVSEEGTVSIRYFDSSDRTRPLLARPPVPTVLWAHEPIIEESDAESSYATLPFQKFTSFKSPPLPVKPPPLMDTSRRISRDDRDILCHTPPNQSQSSSSNVFCKAVVHMHEPESFDDYLRAKV